jgi:hypothetical protein
MGDFRIGPVLRVLATLGACAVLSLNFVLLADTFGVANTVPPLKSNRSSRAKAAVQAADIPHRQGQVLLPAPD